MAGQSIDLPEVRREVLQRGLWFEEFEPGTRYLHRPGRTVTEADNVLFTTLTMNTQSLHLDAAWAEDQPFGERLVNSMFTLATIVGASVAQLTQGTIVANLGFTEVAFPAPMYHGDTLYSETLVVATRESASRIVTLHHVGRNQHGVEVARATRSVLMWMREAGERQAAAATEAAGSPAAGSPAAGSGSRRAVGSDEEE